MLSELQDRTIVRSGQVTARGEACVEINPYAHSVSIVVVKNPEVRARLIRLVRVNRSIWHHNRTVALLPFYSPNTVAHTCHPSEGDQHDSRGRERGELTQWEES